MHVLIFAPGTEAADGIRAALGNASDGFDFASSWSDVISSLEDDPPDLVLIERAALAQVEASHLQDLIRPGLWPPLVLMDTLTGDGPGTLSRIRHLVQPSLPFYQVGDLCIDTRKKRVGLEGRWVTLPPIQYRLLLALARKAGQVVSYQSLVLAVWGYKGDNYEARELIKVHIRQIRRRLGLKTEERRYIHSVRGFGYMLESPDEG